MARSDPLWLAAPSRFAGLRKAHARLALALLALLVAACFAALAIGDPPALGASSGGDRNRTDLGVYEDIVAGVRGGGNYYEVAADALRAGGYPLRPFLTMRQPALAAAEASMPPWLPGMLLVALALFTGMAWMLRLTEAMPRLAPRLIAALLLAGSMLAFFQPGLAAFHEIWAGLLVALSLALRRPGRWIEAAAIGLAAMLIRETAALYVLVMAVFAWREGARREAMGWGAALLLFAAVLGVHAWAVAGVTGPNDPASPGWLGLQGPGLFVKGIALSTALQLVPLWAAAPLVGLALFGWASWNDPLAARALALFAGYALALALFARLDTFYWALMASPVILAGLAFVPDGLRDLARQSLDRRRVTVTRIAQ
ncbi:DUF2079 domain-containing protein [Sphingomonas canadensis]|uniref:DUF2079 domain-containing protein n=1 Tax=Sphingomonas canadensis TaxID=1219257 RepID=A0ABW3H3V4_9SPHN|nr:DUF2079 domain-containing protein [Sphingomonas canadensis]MCW3835422.1 DUF2079 domain-containing protein [Sphingomonas canadensis]